MYLKDDLYKWKAMCVSNRCVPPYPNIKEHYEKRPKWVFLIGGAHSVRVALYPSPCNPIAISLNSQSIRVCPMFYVDWSRSFRVIFPASHSYLYIFPMSSVKFNMQTLRGNSKFLGVCMLNSVLDNGENKQT